MLIAYARPAVSSASALPRQLAQSAASHQTVSLSLTRTQYTV